MAALAAAPWPLLFLSAGGGAFFEVPAGGVDLCNVNVPVRRKPA